MVLELDKAKGIVENHFPDADEPVLEELLEQSAGFKNVDNEPEKHYRPWYVAAQLMLTHYQKIERADIVTFVYEDYLSIASNLMNLQGKMDKGLEIPEGFDVNDNLGALIISVAAHG